MMKKISKHNAQVWDRIVAQGSGFAAKASTRVLSDPHKHINIYNWLPQGVHGRKVLCLAAGGGKHAPLYAAAGANVTVLDVSEAMLERDQEMARQHGFSIRCIHGCMTQMPLLQDAEFDLVMQPVSACYIQELDLLYQEVARVLKPGGLYIVQHKQPVSLQCGAFPKQGAYWVDHEARHKGPLPVVRGSEHREEGALEFLHPLEDLLGGLCRRSFVIEDVREPWHGKSTAPAGSFFHRSQSIPPYIAIKARRRMDSRIAFSPILAETLDV
ncbi:class I SAM-dependent methyltransferase [bacterium]|nr:class I SAM-dependent methyltransferase [bacterium]MDG1893264.1 class I SAM-dependent methyltransferase [Verrucomicrobiota bacterium]